MTIFIKKFDNEILPKKLVELVTIVSWRVLKSSDIASAIAVVLYVAQIGDHFRTNARKTNYMVHRHFDISVLLKVLS